MAQSISRNGKAWSNAAEDRIELIAPDVTWARQYEAEAAVLRSVVPEISGLRIEHFGSTSIPGVRAKPIIDIMLIHPEPTLWPDLVGVISPLGYVVVTEPTQGSDVLCEGNVGAWILGRNMFGPIRGSWPDMNWKGWWGDNPPYHVPTFILTHHARPPIQMEGGTTFYFVTGGIHEALDRARDAANGMDVRIGGGPGTIQQYLRTGLIDELHVAISPVLLGGGERLFEGIDVRALGYECVRFVASEKATHVLIRRQGHNDA